MDKQDKKNNPGSEVKSSEDKNSGRRKLLKSVVAGGGAVTVAKMLPDQWARPVVDSVMLPSHAQTSMAAIGAFLSSGPITMLSVPTQQLADQGFSEELLEFFTPAAHAGFEEPNSFAFSANETGDSFLCATSNVSSEITAVQLNGTDPESFNGSASTCLFGGEVQGGQFNGTEWVVTILPPSSNISVDVTLFQGGVGCTENEDPGQCQF